MYAVQSANTDIPIPNPNIPNTLQLMAFMSFIEIFSAVVCFIVLCWWRNTSNGLPMNYPFVGMLPSLLLHIHRIHDWTAQVLELTSCTFLLKGPWFSNMDMLWTTDPANVHYVMSSNFSNFPKGSEFVQIFDILGDGIFNSDDVLWKNQRKAARLLLSHQQFYKYLVSTSREKVETGLIPILEHVSRQEKVLDLQDLFQRFTFDATCILVTGYDPGCLSIDFPEVPFSKALDDAEEALFYRHVMPGIILKLQRCLGVGGEKKLSKAWETLDLVIANYISMKREDIKSKGKDVDHEKGVDLLTSYMNDENIGNIMGFDQSHNDDDKFLRDTILNFMLAGRDTTSSALTWFFWLLSINPTVEAKIREELKLQIPPQESGKPWLFNIQDLSKLVYLHGALCEALRLYPPVPFEHKSPSQPDILPSGHHVNPKSRIMFSSYAMGRMRSVWGEDCLKFKPERWISERGEIKHQPSYKFFAFNAGPRICLGKEVAFTQLKTVAAAIIHNYNVEVEEGHPVAASTSIILHMKHGLRVRIRKRWD